MTSKSNDYRVSGAIVDAIGNPIAGIRVAAFDKDFWREQPLGHALTNKTGGYEIRFGRDAFTGPLLRLERAPDIFLRVLDAEGNLLATTRQSVVIDAGKDTRIDVVAKDFRSTPPRPGMSILDGEPVNLLAAAKLTKKDLIEAYHYLRRPAMKPKKVDLIHSTFPGLFTKRDPGDDCGEGYADIVRRLIEERGGDADEITDADDLPAGATVNWFYTQNIQVKYTTDTGYPDDRVDPAVPGADAPFTLDDGTPLGTLRKNLADLHPSNTVLAPTYVQKVGLLAEYALSQWVNAPFSLRDPRGGAARMEYRILKQPPNIAGQTSASWSHVEVGPDNTDTQNSFTVPHELMHQFQYQYNDTTTRSGIYGIVREGGARFGVESINDEPNRYVDSAKAIFDTPWQSLETATGVKNPIRYAAGLLWKYVAEQHSTLTAAADEPAIGVDTYRKVLEATATVQAGDPGVGYVATALRSARGNMPWYGRWDQISYYDPAKTELGSHETTWGNYLVANYLHGTANPVPDARFEYKEDEDPVTFGTVAKLADLQSALSNAAVTLSQGTSVSLNVAAQDAWCARYYKIVPDPASPPRMLRVGLAAAGGMADPMLQILRLGPGDALQDIHRSEDPSYTKTINMDGLESVVVIVASRENAGSFTLNLDEIASDSDVHVTRWNTQQGKEYETNPRGYTWHWVSPDIMVDNDGDGAADTEVFFDRDNALKVRLRNRGNAAANNLTVEFWYQKATPYLNSASWMPVTDAAGTVQTIVGESLDAQGGANDQKWLSVNWAPANDGTNHKHWCVKVRVTAPGDPNSDNKIVLSNFGNVIPPPDGDSLLSIFFRYNDGLRKSGIHIIPRGPKWTFKPERPPKFRVPDRTKFPVPERCCGGPRILQAPNRAVFGDFAVVKMAKSDRFKNGAGLLAPREDEYYPVDPETLPPGVDPASLVTVIHEVDGHPVGGVTYTVAPKKR